MSPLERLRWAIAPHQGRGLKIMFGGIAVFTALGGAATLLEVPRAVAGLMGLAMLAAWFVAACGVVGYFRGFFRAEVDEQSRQ